MKKTTWMCAFFSLLLLGSPVFAIDRGEHLNQPPPPVARELVKRAVLLAESDKPWAALAALKKALVLAPDYLPAHVEYRNVKANFLDRSDEANAEYESLVKRSPRNPVYLMAVYFRSNGIYGRESLQRVVELAPEWAWGHYAKGLLLQANDPEGAVIEFQHCIEKDNSAGMAYLSEIQLQEGRLHRIDEAIRTAEQLAAQTDIRAQFRLGELWRLRLIKNQRSEEAKSTLANELLQLETSSEVDTLVAVHSACLDLLKDPERARLIEQEIVALDPSWIPERGALSMRLMRNQSRVPRYEVLANRQIALFRKAVDMAGATSLSGGERIVHLKELLGEQPNAAVRRMIYEEIFKLAVRSRNVVEARTYGRRLHLIDPDDSALLSQMALVLADKKAHLTEALYFARKAEALTAVFRRPRRPPNTNFEEHFPEQAQREEYKRDRALALDALGWTLTQMREPRQAEPWLRQAIDIAQSESRLRRLAEALQQQGRNDEAAVIESEADKLLADTLRILADTVRSKFTNEPVADLQLDDIDGRHLKLADLKGKVVLIDFWATWCGSCREEMPALKKLYEKYKDHGLEIVAISVDEDSSKVRPFAAANGLRFPVVHSTALGEQFKAESIPASLFIDKLGNLRYRKEGFEEGDEREVEILIMELLK